MRCDICDATLSKPDYNAELGAYEPCGVCLEVINDTLASFMDKPAAEEDDLGGPDPILSGHFPQDGYSIINTYDPYEDTYEPL